MNLDPVSPHSAQAPPRRTAPIQAAWRILALGLWLALCSSARAGYTDSLGLGSRATGLGNACIGVADDLSANYYNPAGLTRLIGGETFDLMLSTNMVSARPCYVEPIADPRSNIQPGQSLRIDGELPTWAPTPSVECGFGIGERLYVVLAGSGRFGPVQ